MKKKQENLKWKAEKLGGSISPPEQKKAFMKARLEFKIKKVQAKLDFLR